MDTPRTTSSKAAHPQSRRAKVPRGRLRLGGIGGMRWAARVFSKKNDAKNARFGHLYVPPGKLFTSLWKITIVKLGESTN